MVCPAAELCPFLDRPLQVCATGLKVTPPDGGDAEPGAGERHPGRVTNRAPARKGRTEIRLRVIQCAAGELDLRQVVARCPDAERIADPFADGQRSRMRLQRVRVTALLPMHDADVVQGIRLPGDIAAGFVQLQAPPVVIDGHSRVCGKGRHRSQVLVGVRARVVGARLLGVLRRREQRFAGLLV